MKKKKNEVNSYVKHDLEVCSLIVKCHTGMPDTSSWKAMPVIPIIASRPFFTSHSSISFFASAILSSFVCSLPTMYKPKDDLNAYRFRGSKPISPG